VLTMLKIMMMVMWIDFGVDAGDAEYDDGDGYGDGDGNGDGDVVFDDEEVDDYMRASYYTIGAPDFARAEPLDKGPCAPNMWNPLGYYIGIVLMLNCASILLTNIMHKGVHSLITQSLLSKGFWVIKRWAHIWLRILSVF